MRSTFQHPFNLLGEMNGKLGQMSGRAGQMNGRLGQMNENFQRGRETEPTF